LQTGVAGGGGEGEEEACEDMLASHFKIRIVEKTTAASFIMKNAVCV